MRSSLFLAATVATLCAPSVFFGADKEGGGGGSSVADLLAKISSLEGDKKTLTTQLADETKKVTALETEKGTLTTQLDDSGKKVTALELEKTGLEAKVKTLTTEKDTADQRANERAAANGVNAVEREQTEVNAKPGSEVALWEKYLKSDATERAHMRATQAEALDKSAAAYDKAKAAQAA